MREDSRSIFRHLAGSIQAKHIQSALGPSIRAGLSMSDASEVLIDSAREGGYWEMSRISLVVADDDQVVSWIGFDMLTGGSDGVGSVAEPVVTGQMLSGDTPALEVVKLFAQNSNSFYFVLQEAQITGTLHYEDLFRSPFKLCLFALVLELEAAALDLALKEPAASWSALPSGRQHKAEEVYEKKYHGSGDRENPPFDDLLSCTMYCDKATILRKLGIGADCSIDINSLFSKAEGVRNSCAHTNSENDRWDKLMNRASLPDFIAQIEKITGAIRDQLRKELP